MSQIIKFLAQILLTRQARVLPRAILIVMVLAGSHFYGTYQGRISRAMGAEKQAVTVGEVIRVVPIQSTRRLSAVVSYEYQAGSGKRYSGSSAQILESAGGVVVGDKITVTYRVRNPRRSWIVALRAPAPGIMQKPQARKGSLLEETKHWSGSWASMLGFLLYGGFIALVLYRLLVSPLLKLYNFLAGTRGQQGRAPATPTAMKAGQQKAVMTDLADAIASYGRRAATLVDGAKTKPMPGSLTGRTQHGGGLPGASQSGNAPPPASRYDGRDRSETSRYKPRIAPQAVSHRKRRVKIRAGWFG